MQAVQAGSHAVQAATLLTSKYPSLQGQPVAELFLVSGHVVQAVEVPLHVAHLKLHAEQLFVPLTYVPTAHPQVPGAIIVKFPEQFRQFVAVT